MKKVIVLLFVLVSLSSYGQNAYEANDKILNIGFSVGSYSYGFSGSRSGSFLPITASLEFGITDKFSVGPYIGYASWKYRFLATRYSYSFLTVGVRGTYHATAGLNNALDASINETKLDLYVSLLAGLEFRTFDGENTLLLSNDTVFRLGPLIGAKYMLGKKIGIYGELGRGTLGLFTIGVSANL